MLQSQPEPDLPEIDVAEITSQRRETELDLSACEWTKLPPIPQPGQMPLSDALAAKVDLEPGTPITLDEWVELTLCARGLPAKNRSRKKNVRPFVWDIVLKRPEKKLIARN